MNVRCIYINIPQNVAAKKREIERGKIKIGKVKARNKEKKRAREGEIERERTRAGVWEIEKVWVLVPSSFLADSSFLSSLSHCTITPQELLLIISRILCTYMMTILSFLFADSIHRSSTFAARDRSNRLCT